MLILKYFYQSYQYHFITNRDQRVDDKILMSSVLVPIVLIVLYLKFVLHWGQDLMKNRRPYNIDKIIIIYNIVQIVWNLALFCKSVYYTYGFGGYSFFCQPVDTSNSEVALLIVDGVYQYLLIKLLDFLDSIFFVLRKKNKQLTFLHVYHHAGVFALAWCGYRAFPGGQTVFIGFLNTFVHVVMYSYYLYVMLAKPKYVWWKKYLTQLQIIQFFLIGCNFVALWLTEDCGFPKWSGIVVIPQNFFLTAMFSDFYYRTYIKKKPQVS